MASWVQEETLLYRELGLNVLERGRSDASRGAGKGPGDGSVR